MSTLLVRVLLTLAAALAASWVSLLYRYRRKGRPFSCLQTAGLSLAIITVTTTAATGIGLALPQVVEAMPPATIGVLIPTLLCTARAGKPEPAAERSVWYEIATVGVSLLLDRLEQKMHIARDSWSEARVHGNWTLSQLEEAIWQVNATLVRRVSDRRRQNRLRSDFDAACEAVRTAEEAIIPREVLIARHTAEQALIMMLGRAWDWGCTDITTSCIEPSPAAGKDPPRLDATP